MSLVIRELQQDDLQLMVDQIRPMDAFEFDVMTDGKDHMECFQELLQRSAASRVAFIDGKLLCIFGVTARTALSPNGHPWLAATDLVNSPAARRAIVANTHDQLADMSKRFSRLWNIVYEENHIAIRWLRWIGFTFNETPIDIRGHRFLKFEKDVAKCA